VRSPIIPKPRSRPDENREAWGADRVLLVADKHDAPYRAIPMLAAGCGLRQGEAFALAEDDFDFEAGKVHIRRQVIRIGKAIVFKLPKGGKERTAPLSLGLARLAKAQIEAYEPQAYTLPWMQEDGQLAEDEHVCKILFRWHGDHPRTHGKCLQTSSYNEEVWKPALSAAGVIPPAKKNARGIYRYESAREHGMHALRHFYSTTLLDAGVSLAGVMSFLGHSKKGAPVTLGVYAHVTEETFESARNAVDQSLFRLRVVQDHSFSGTEAEQAASQ
jgi:integrase